jgi:hypothetical protein
MNIQESRPPNVRDDWFTQLMGFSERTPEEVRNHTSLDGARLYSKVNGRTYRCGTLEVVSLGNLRKTVSAIKRQTGKLQIQEVVGNVKDLHVDRVNQGSMFQVASQFNLLEMIGPETTPEQGVGIYQNDPTQGPVCAVACGAGTIYRNYFVPVSNQIGQSKTRQIDCLESFGEVRGNRDSRLWKMKNGYMLPSTQGLAEVNSILERCSDDQIDALRSKVRVGIQWDTQVTLNHCEHLVSQIYCSAVPVSYSRLPLPQWERLARLVLEAAYEATFAAAAIQHSKSNNKNLFLTLLGGGAFGNDQQWILNAIARACELYREHDLNVMIVSYRRSNDSIRSLAKKLTLDATAVESKLTSESDSALDHFCPSCGKPLPAILRYPWYICADCVTLAEDTQGRRLQFSNRSLSGGFQYKYIDEADTMYKEARSVVCLIRGRRVSLGEARHGGIVAQPLTSDYKDARTSTGTVDLSQ